MEDLEKQRKNELEKEYIENLLQELNITLEEYMQYCLLLQAEYEQLKKNMIADCVGVDKNGRYSLGTQAFRYREAVDYSGRNLKSHLKLK